MVGGVASCRGWLTKKCFERDEGDPESQAMSFGSDVGSTTSYDEASTLGEKLTDKLGILIGGAIEVWNHKLAAIFACYLRCVGMHIHCGECFMDADGTNLGCLV
jgi:hypothetical protein